MKKLLLASLMVLGVAGFSFAQQGGIGMAADNNPGTANGCQCPMMGGNNGAPHGGPHMGMKRGGPCGDMQGGCGMQDMQVTVKTSDEAKAKVQALITADYKGYKITKTEEFTGRGGHKGFRVLTNDAGGNEFIFHVGPFGNVKGPMLAKNMPEMPKDKKAK